MSALSVDDFRAKIDASRVRCKICGAGHHSLVRHLKNVHNMSVGQYHNQYPGADITSRILVELGKQLPREAQSTDQLETFLPQFVAPTTDALFTQTKGLFPAVKPTNAFLVPDVNPHYVLDEAMAKAVTFALVKGKNTYVEGPTGCGKTDGIKQVHARLGLPIKRVNMNGDVTVANFIGAKHADPQTGTYFKHGNLPMAMTGEYTLLIDEIDYMPPNIAAVLNPVLEGVRELYIPETDEHIVAGKGFNIIALANTGGKGDTTGVYTGTEVLNTAFLDRFAVKLKMDYLDAAAEIDMLCQRFPALPQQRARLMVTAARDVRDQFKQGLIPITLSTRKLIDIFEMESVLGLKEAVNCAVLNWLDDDCTALIQKVFENRGIDLK